VVKGVLMTLAETFKAAYLDFKRDFEPETQRETDAFTEGFKSGVNVVIAYMIEHEQGGDKK
jgi:hypothetical protein